MLNFSAIGRAWTNGNNISSDGETSQVMLPDLDEGATELFGRLVRIDGKARLGGIFDYQPILPGRHVTQDGFDQVEAYYSLDSVLNYLNTLGIDPQQIIGSQHKGIPHPVVAHVNAVDDLNAWYAPEDDDLTFGTNGDMSKGQDKWHLASDSDVTVHEMGHLLLDHMNKRLGGWMNNSQNVKRMGDPGDDDEPGAEANEGLAIHEAFGDLLSAFYFDDPEMGEDFSPSIGQPPSKKSGLRNVENNATLDKVGNEPHDRSLAYSGFFWSVKKDLSDPNGPFKLTSRQASDVALKLLFNHAGNYGTANPTSADFVKAVLAGTDALAASGQLGVDPQALKSVIGAESYRRKLISGQPNAFMAKRGPRSFDELKSMVGTSGAFTLDQRSAFFGGTQEIYSQQYVTSKGQRVDVLGGNVFVQKNKNGNIVSFSASDVRDIKPGEIDETVKIDFRAAMTIAYGATQKMLLNPTPPSFKFAPSSNRPQDRMEAFKNAQMDRRIAETAMRHFTTRGLIPEQPKLVVLPGTSFMSYEIKVGLGIYYIDARNGAATFKRDVIVN